MASANRFWVVSLAILTVAGALTGIRGPINDLTNLITKVYKINSTPPYVEGPFTATTISPTVYNGDLRDLPQLPSTRDEVIPQKSEEENEQKKIDRHTIWNDPVAQLSFAQGQMPSPLMNFEGLDIKDGGGWHPPDTNGDVGSRYYIQTVKIAFGIYDKATGEEVVKLSYDTFFQGPPDSACDDQNRGDVIVLYDPQVDRWVITDFALPGPNYYECIAVSQTGDPIRGGWYFYELKANTGSFIKYWNDYPKLSVWSDGWYMTANMFSQVGHTYGGVRVWALNREDALVGEPMRMVYFDCTDYGQCSTLLPANLRGEAPPSGSPEYFANIVLPKTVNIWRFHTDWAQPDTSTFTGPAPVNVADYHMFLEVPQKDTSQKLNSLGDRLMFALQYRNINGVAALYATHSVASGVSSGIRWYEIRNPDGIPVLYQQGTYQPDENYRWMGSITADKDGNIAIGYSVSSDHLFPSIRYAGRLAGEAPNMLTQNEASLVEGTGSQENSDRWGDYSSMSIDPVDDCTFWYTQEFVVNTSNEWQTRIGSFKYPSCGQDKGTIAGYVYDPENATPLAGVLVYARGAQYNFTAITDSTGHYMMNLKPGSYDMSAGSPGAGVSGSDAIDGVVVKPFSSTPQDFEVRPVQ